MNKVIDFIKGSGIVMYINLFVKNHPAEKYGKNLALALNDVLRNEVGQTRKEVIKNTVIPWVDRLYMSFRKTLIKCIILFVLLLNGCGYTTEIMRDKDGRAYKVVSQGQGSTTVIYERKNDKETITHDSKTEPLLKFDIPMSKIGG